MWVCLFDDADVETRHALTELSLGHLARRGPGRRGRAPATATAPTGRGSPSWACASTPTSCCSTPTPARSAAPGRRPGDLRLRPGVAGPPRRRATPRRTCPKGVVVHDPDFDWGDDRRPYTRWRDTVIYELHVKGMTALHDRVPEHLRGTYAGLATPAVIDYLRDLGVTAVELLPVQQFVSEPRVMARGMANYWGYNTLGFFAPHNGYSSARRPRRAGAGVQGDGQGVPRGRARGDPRRGLQPHGRGRGRRADPVVPRARRPRLLPPGRPPPARRRRTTTPTGTSPAAATPSTPPTRSRCG